MKPLSPHEVHATLENQSQRLQSLETRVDLLESRDLDRITINMHHMKSSIPPQVRKHGATAIVVTVLAGLIELARYLGAHWQ